MPSADGPQGPSDHGSDRRPAAASEAMELQLFESLVHHLVEKGVLTRNDALSVVQTVAQVKLGEQETASRPAAHIKTELGVLERLYSSFELMTDRAAAHLRDRENVIQLRPPLHGDKPRFPKDEN